MTGSIVQNHQENLSNLLLASCLVCWLVAIGKTSKPTSSSCPSDAGDLDVDHEYRPRLAERTLQPGFPPGMCSYVWVVSSNISFAWKRRFHTSQESRAVSAARSLLQRFGSGVTVLKRFQVRKLCHACWARIWVWVWYALLLLGVHCAKVAKVFRHQSPTNASGTSFGSRSGCPYTSVQGNF